MSSDEGVTLYSALDRNKKRQMMVSLSSSSDELSDDGNSFEDFAILETPVKRRRYCASLDKDAKSGESLVKEGNLLALPHSSDEDNDVDSPSEKEADHQRKLQLEREIRQELESDKVLNQTRAILNKVLVTKRQTTADNSEVISLDSDSSDDSDAACLIETVARPSSNLAVAKEAQIVLRVRSNGGAVDEVAIYKKGTFEQLYTSFCELHGLPRTAVTMSLDGKVLAPKDCVGDNISDYLIEAKVDFSKQIESKKKRYLRLRLVVFGRRSEIYKIDSTATIQKLHTSYCKRHGIANPDDVVMSMQNQELRLNERLDFYGLIDHDEISVKVSDNLVSRQTIAVQLRFSEDDSEIHQVIPDAEVAVLLAKVAKEKGSKASKISLMIDGEKMASSRTFTSYDLEGGELIEVNIAS
ncbi:unnamed protein product [Hyaloperonospora brassicae]|uniref:Ubiquitin-like domain-containing protein n=1 Tax=Hyaloperonospora brassicae TaxID=162125 RepID=A0AAV0UZF4_HYABA|nr:unnamed protein product [Hyaloperonospora brassicae]